MAGERMTELLAAKRGDEARHLAHSVKGLAANLGMMDLSAAAAHLEVSDEPAAFTTALALVVGNISATLPAAEAASTACVPVQDSQFQNGLARLRALLTKSEADAVECFGEMHPMLRGLVEPEELASLEREVENYNFTAALERLARLFANQ